MFDRDAFLGLSSLRSLRLDNCDLKTTPPLDPIKYSLEYLDLKHNALMLTEPNYFFGFRRLTALDLSDKIFSAIPDISPLADTLMRLFIVDNVVASLETFLYNSTYTELTSLDVTHNNISELTPKMISQWPRLAYLSIEYKMLETLDDLSGIKRGYPALKVSMGNQTRRNQHAHKSTRCGLVTSYGDKDLSQHWAR